MMVPVRTVDYFLDERHYLGRAPRGQAWSDEYGVLVLAPPTSRKLPVEWLELSRWCLRGQPNDGSRQWSSVAKWLRANSPATTVISYSDPSVGHTGALYRACNWWYAPTWMRLVPPPSGGGSWDGGKTKQAPKDRWVFALKPDERRVKILRVEDGYVRRFPWAEYREPGGADWRPMLNREMAQAA